MNSGDSPTPASPRPPDAVPAAVTAYLTALGVHARPARLGIRLLADDWQTLAELVRRTAQPRRTVEDLLAALAPDLDTSADRHRLRPARIAAYRPLTAAPGDVEPGDVEPRDVEPGPDDPLLAVIAADIASGPPPTPAMDHVPADPATVLRRARWLDAHYLLDGARLLFLGDHDLTSLAVCALRPELAVTVVDLDERVLAHVDRIAAERGYDIRCRHADLRFGLPPVDTGSADLVFSDPPYTPEGMGLFAANGLAALRDPVTEGRLVLAYGYSPRSPALGLKVQQELQRLGLVFEAILPHFHRYHGAQAIGSAADLYVCQPTAHATGSGKGRTGIYTHGPQSVEAATEAAPDVLAALHEHAAADGFRVTARKPGWAKPITARGGEAVSTVLTADPGPWLLRTLLATNADRVAVLVRNNHPDLATAEAQQSLAAALRPKYVLRYLRSTPDSAHAVVLATAVQSPEPKTSAATAPTLLHKAHGTLSNVWREALIAQSAGHLTKNQARDQITSTCPPGIDLSARLIDLPRHQLTSLLHTLTQKTGRE